NGFEKIPFSLSGSRLCTLGASLNRQLPSQSPQLCLIHTLLTAVNRSQRLGQYSQSLFHLLPFPIRFDQQGKKRRPPQLCPRGPQCVQALAYLANPLFYLSLHGQGPALPRTFLRQVERKPLLDRERN